MRYRPWYIVLALTIALTGVVAPGSLAGSTDDEAVQPEDLFGEDDTIHTPNPEPPPALPEGGTAAYTDPLGLIEFFEFTSFYSSQAVDRIAVFTCPFAGAVGLTAAQATALGNGDIRDHFLELSEGQYTVEFVTGFDIPVASGSTQAACENYAEANYAGPTVSGAIYVADINGGVAGPGFSCAAWGWCPATWPGNSRSGFVTDHPSFIDMVWAHEHGHMITWPHSYTGLSDPYDNPIDLMSGNLTANGSSNGDPYETNAANRLAAGWLDSSDVFIHDGDAVAVDITTAGGDGVELAVIRIDANSFWALGARIADADDPFPSSWNGVEVMRIDGCGDTCYPLSRRHIPYGTTPWVSGRPVHMLPVGGSALLYNTTVTVQSGDGDSFMVSFEPSIATRISGGNRYETAVALSEVMFPDPGVVDTVFVATGANFPDALGAAAAAGHLGAPVLLVGGGMSSVFVDEMFRLSPDQIFIVGGPAVVSSDIENQLKSWFGDEAVTRVSGVNRYETAVAVSQGVFTDPGAVDTVFIATGTNFPDALGAAASAGHLGGPVLLVGSSLLPAVRDEISRLTPQKIYIVGGTGVVPSEIESTLKSLFGDEAVERISGPNRYETAVNLSEAVFTDAGAVDKVFLATGSNFPDALGAAAAAGHLGVPVLLVGDSLPGVVAGEITRLNPDPVYVIGGSSVVPDAVLAAL